MKSAKVKLGDVCEFIRGVTFDKAEATTMPEAGKLPILRAGNIGKELDAQNDLVWVPESRVANEQRLRRNDIAICMSSGSPEIVGKTARVPANLRASVGSFCGIIRPRQTEQAGFLSFYFRSPAFAKQRDAIARGANIQNLRFSSFEEIEVDIPDEQQRIAKQLEQADRLRRTRRYALELSDSFLPAAFLELFGDPVTNPRGWERAKVSELGEVVTGSTPPRENVGYYGNAIEWIKSDNIGLAQIYPATAVEGLSEKGIAVGTVVDSGALLLTCIAGSEASIGNVVLADRRVAFNQQINAVIPHRGVDSLFLYGLFLASKPYIQRKTTQAMKRMITKGKLEELVLIKPPLALQQKFAALVARHERLRATQREALRQAEHLFQTLLHEAFSEGV